jgi:hypothetical protein
VRELEKPRCEEIRKQLDAYMADRVSTETRKQIDGHLDDCSRCSEDLEARLKVKGLVQGAVQRQALPLYLESRIRAKLRGAEGQGFTLWPWAPAVGLAAVVLLVVFSGQFGWRGQTDPSDLDKTAQERYIDSLYRGVAAIFQVGLGDHLHCAHFRKFPEVPPSWNEMAAKMGPEYAALIPAVKEKVPGEHHIVLAHQCKYRGRNFVHVVTKGEGRLVSLVLTRKRPGESFQSPELVAIRNATGIRIYGAKAESFEVSGFEAGEHLAFVVSNMPQEEHLVWTASLAPAVHQLLTAAQG